MTTTQTVELPFPPSANNLFAHGIVAGKPRRFPTRRYRLWREEAAWKIARAKIKPVSGPVEVRIRLYPPNNQRRDADNFVKALLDTIVSARVLEDDRYVTKVTSEWRPADGVARAVVEIEPQRRGIAD